MDQVIECVPIDKSFFHRGMRMQIEIKLDLSRRSRHLMHQLKDFE